MSDLAKKFKNQRVIKFEEFRHKRMKGADGSLGPQGLAGEQGPVGPKGATGEKGDTGPKGPQGPIGPQGATGHNGVDGVIGPAGDLGPMPKHQTRGDAIRFEIAPNTWGKWISLASGQPVQQPLSLGSMTDSRVISLITEFGGAVATDFNVLIDTVGDLKYIGYSVPGTATSASLWKIKLIDLSAEDIPILWANGSADLNKVWDDRATYTYTETGA